MDQQQPQQHASAVTATLAMDDSLEYSHEASGTFSHQQQQHHQPSTQSPGASIAAGPAAASTTASTPQQQHYHHQSSSSSHGPHSSAFSVGASAVAASASVEDKENNSSAALGQPPATNPVLATAPGGGGGGDLAGSTSNLETSKGSNLESSLSRLNSAALILDTPKTKTNVVEEMRRAVSEVGAADAEDLKGKIRKAAEVEEHVPTPHPSAAPASGGVGSPGGGSFGGGRGGPGSPGVGSPGGEEDFGFDARRTISRGGAGSARMRRTRQSREGQLAERLKSENLYLSGSRRRLLAQTKKMNWKQGAGATARQKHIEELAKKHVKPNFMDKVSGKFAKNGTKFSNLDDVVNCTFQPKVGKHWGEAARHDDDDDEEKKEDDDPVAAFIKRSDAWTRKVREDKAEAIGKRDYESLLTRKVCPECKLTDGKPVYQAYNEFQEKRDVCERCGNKYVRQLTWGAIREEFLAMQVKFKDDKDRKAAEIRRKHVQMVSDPRMTRKKVYDDASRTTRSVPVFATYRGDDEKEEIWSGFLNRTASDNRRRTEDRAREEKDRRRDITRVDPNCTFSPHLNREAGFPHLTAIFDRLEGQDFEDRMEDDVRARRAASKRAQRERGPITDQLPTYLKANEGWLTDYKHPERMPGYYDAEEAGFGGNITAHGPFDKDSRGRPLEPKMPDRRDESKYDDDDDVAARRRLDDKVVGTGWIED